MNDLFPRKDRDLKSSTASAAEDKIVPTISSQGNRTFRILRRSDGLGSGDGLRSSG
jgi:hypothetical protein